MKKLLLVLSAAIIVAGCVAYPAYDGRYYYPYYGYYPYGYGEPGIGVFISGAHERYYFHGGDHYFYGGGFRGRR